MKYNDEIVNMLQTCEIDKLFTIEASEAVVKAQWAEYVGRHDGQTLELLTERIDDNRCHVMVVVNDDIELGRRQILFLLLLSLICGGSLIWLIN